MKGFTPAPLSVEDSHFYERKLRDLATFIEGTGARAMRDLEKAVKSCRPPESPLSITEVEKIYKDLKTALEVAVYSHAELEESVDLHARTCDE